MPRTWQEREREDGVSRRHKAAPGGALTINPRDRCIVDRGASERIASVGAGLRNFGEIPEDFVE